MAETILARLTVDETTYIISDDVGVLGDDLLILYIDSRRLVFVKIPGTPPRWMFPPTVGEPYYLPSAVIARLAMWMT